MKETPYLEGKKDLLDKFKTIPAFQPFEDTRLMQMLALSKIRRYTPGETIMEEGAFDCWIYFLLSGTVRVLKGGKELTSLRRYGDMFGEMSVVDGSPRSATVQATDNVMCLALDGSVIDRVEESERYPFYALIFRFIAEVLADRLRRTDEEVSRLRALLREHGVEPPRE